MRLLQHFVSLWLISTTFVAALPHEQRPVGPETRDQRLAEGWVDEEAKYFHEPGNTDLLGHYDVRYYRGVVTNEERSETLRHMIRAYLGFFRDHGLETWIAHGTLLGWWWNGRILPWDWDIDTQVSGETLGYMAKHLNNTRHKYVAPKTSTAREYLLDVNPMSYERVRGDGMNIIDARWIDTTTGLFIDITGLSETQPYVNPGVVSCKNLHRYRLNDLYPMRETIFEGVTTKIPYAYDKLLVEEYEEKALTLTDYEGHHWDARSKQWVPRPSINPVHTKEPVNWLRKRSR